MSSIGSLRISEPKKRYITERLNPLLEEMVTECLSSMPDDPLNFMIDWLRRNKLADPDQENVEAENEQLKAQIAQHEALVESKSSVIASIIPASAEGEDEEEEEDDGEDECDDELPEGFRQSEITMNKARQSISAEVIGEWNQKKEFVPPVFEKTDDQKQRIRKVLKNSFMFTALEDRELNVVIDAMKEMKLKAGERPIKQGDEGDYLFIIESGTLDCWKKFPDEEEEKLVKSVEAEDCFGELAILYNCPRAASVESRDDCILWQLDRETFSYIVKDAAAKKREKYTNFLDQVPILEKTTDVYQKNQISDALRGEHFVLGDTIITEGETGDKFYILEEGECAAFKDGEEVMRYKAGQYFGELALLKDEPRAATVKVTSETARLLVLERKAFKRLLGPLRDLLTQASAKYF